MARFPDETDGEGLAGFARRHWPAATSLFALVLVVGLMARDCARQPPPALAGVSPLSARAVESPAAASSVPAGSPTPTPTPTPIPKTRYEGGIVIKLPRGVDVGAGVPVALVDVEGMEEAASRAADSLDQALDLLLADLVAARSELASARSRSRDLAQEVEGIHRAAWLEARATAEPQDEGDNKRLEDIVNKRYRLPFAREAGAPAATVEDAIERARAMGEALEAALLRADADANEDRTRASKELETEEYRYRTVNRHRPHTEKQSRERIDQLRAQIHQNEYARLQVILMRARELANERLATPTAELERLAAALDAELPRAVDLASERLKTEFPAERNKLFRETLAAATVAEAHADDRGRFRFEVDPGSRHALFCRYVDLATGKSRVWLAPADAEADNILGIYNALSEESLRQSFPGVAALLYGRGGEAPPSP